MNAIVSKHLIHYLFYFLTGQKVRGHKHQFERTQWLSYEDLKQLQWKKLKRMLCFAYEAVPFYRERFVRKGVRPNDINAEEDLLKIEVLTKEDIIKNFESLTSERRGLTNFSRATSGSTGSPLRLVKDGASLAAMDAIMYRNYNWFGVDMGQKQARYWGSPLSGSDKIKLRIKDTLLNRIRFSPFDVSERTCYQFICRLRKFRPHYVYGYSQTIFKFSEYVIRNGFDLSSLKLKALILTGEMISADQIETIKAAFKCSISNEYGCTEVGIIAMECPHKGMHLMVENLFIEFVKDGKHALPGEEGEIIVTELYGNLMPLIRYQVEDIGSPDDKLCECGRGLPLLGRLKGRNDEFIICPDGKQVDPIIFEYVLKEIPSKYGQVTHFRIIQESHSQLTIDLCYSGTSSELMFGEIEKRLKRAIGEVFTIHFRLTDSIPVEPSGKLRCFVSQL